MNFKRVIKFWWQRRTRGWDNSEIWSLDYTIAKFLVPRLKELRSYSHSYPGDITSEEWDAILDEMIEGFELFIREDWPENKVDWEKIQKSADLLAKWFLDLWT